MDKARVKIQLPEKNLNLLSSSYNLIIKAAEELYHFEMSYNPFTKEFIAVFRTSRKYYKNEDCYELKVIRKTGRSTNIDTAIQQAFSKLPEFREEE